MQFLSLIDAATPNATATPDTGQEVLQTFQSMSVDTLDTDLLRLWELVLPIIKSLAFAILLFIVGSIAIKLVKKAVKKSFKKSRKFDKSVTSFALSAIDITLKVLLIVSVIATLGVEITSIIAIFGAASFAIGLALQGSLENFAGGVMLLVFKPFKVGDYVESGDYRGVVDSMSIVSTKLNTFDNKQIIIPNSKISSDTLVNYSTNDRRRIDISVGVDYSSDIDKVKSVLLDVIRANNKIHDMPEPIIGIEALADSSVNFAVKVWVETENFLEVKFYLNEEIKKTLDKNGIDIPYPHLTIVQK